MSRTYKGKLADLAEGKGATGVKTNVEKLSGADLAQVLMAANSGASATVAAGGKKTLGNNSAAKSGADIQR